MKTRSAESYAVTINACKMCTPLGAVLAFAGVQGALTLLHGSQGCATYIRRYLISHFREPLDVASSSFTEHSAVFGGREQLRAALGNLVMQYKPRLIGIATTCLAETTGEDLPASIRDWQAPEGFENPCLVPVSTASYRGTHREGFQSTVRALVEHLSKPTPAHSGLAIFTGMWSTADLRFIKDSLSNAGLEASLASDYSDTLDGGLWTDWEALPPGGTPLEKIAAFPGARASLSLAPMDERDAGSWLEKNYGVKEYKVPMPLGVRASDEWYRVLAELGGKADPRAEGDRRRLLDSYTDGHKVVAACKLVIYGEEDLALALALWAIEAGMKPVLVASGAKTSRLAAGLPEGITCMDDSDFDTIESFAADLGAELILGNSKGHKMSQKLGIPLVRLGFPIHDRFGGQRFGLLGYGGTQNLYDRVVNAIIEYRQSKNPVSYTYY